MESQNQIGRVDRHRLNNQLYSRRCGVSWFSDAMINTTPIHEYGSFVLPTKGLSLFADQKSCDRYVCIAELPSGFAKKNNANFHEIYTQNNASIHSILVFHYNKKWRIF